MNFIISSGVTSSHEPSERACVGFSSIFVQPYLFEFSQTVVITCVVKKRAKKSRAVRNFFGPLLSATPTQSVMCTPGARRGAKMIRFCAGGRTSLPYVVETLPNKDNTIRTCSDRASLLKSKLKAKRN